MGLECFFVFGIKPRLVFAILGIVQVGAQTSSPRILIYSHAGCGILEFEVHTPENSYALETNLNK